MFLKLENKGFTLLELLVVIAIIGILSAVVLASLNTARDKARDAARKSQLAEVAKALELYFADNGTYRVSGGGSGGNGSGWFSYENGGSYPNSVSQQLSDDGYLGAYVVDPLGNVTTQGGRAGYMITASDTKYTLWANLEDPSTSDTATLDSCYFSTYDNYSSGLAAENRANYCISN